MVLVGGHTPTSNLEVHDMRFVTGHSITDTYETLQNEWWGDPDTLHIDVWGEISGVDGYKIELRTESFTGKEKLFFVNLGGYAEGQFDELHKNILIVETSLEKARHAAKQTIADWSIPHKDTEFEIEKILPLSVAGGYNIHLVKSDDALPFSFHCRYTPVSKKALAKRAGR